MNLACVGTFGASLFIFSNCFVWLRITDEYGWPSYSELIILTAVELFIT